MIFPEELDDKPFRLFVQRTWHALQNNLSLTPSEAETARLISDHPEVGLFFPGQGIDITPVFAGDKFNPFLFLAALREVNKQVISDRPAGMQNLFAQLLAARLGESEARSRMAASYLELFHKQKAGASNYNSETYLLAMKEYLNDSRSFEDPMAYAIPSASDSNTSQYMGDIYDKAYEALKAQMYEEVSSITLTPEKKLVEMLERLPREWIQATASYWQLPKRRLKRDNIRDIKRFFEEPATPEHLRALLTAMERDCLQKVLASGGCTDYQDLVQQFGGEQSDDYWWSKHPPTSTIGQLRLKGLVFIGRGRVSGRSSKMALIPGDLHVLINSL